MSFEEFLKLEESVPFFIYLFIYLFVRGVNTQNW